MNSTTRHLRGFKRHRLIFLLLAGALALSACSNYFDPAAATVAGVKVSQDRLDKQVKLALGPSGGSISLELQRQELMKLIEDELVGYIVAKEKITVAESAVNERIAQVRSQFATEREFTEALATQGLDAPTLRARVRLTLAVQELQTRIRSTIKVPESEVLSTYGNGSSYAEVHVRQILFAGTDQAKALADAKKVPGQVADGADFAALATSLSQDTTTKDKGGDLGWIRRGSTSVPEFEAVAFSLKVGQVSAPIQLEDGYHVIQVTGTRTLTLAQARPEIESRLAEAALREVFQTYVIGWAKRAQIVVNPRYGAFDPARLSINDRQFFSPAPSPTPTGNPHQ